MLVKDVMAKKLHTVGRGDGFRNILKILVGNKISGVPVVNPDNKLVGIISEKDLLTKLFPSAKKFYKDINYYMNFDVIEREAAKINKLKAMNLMTKKVITIGPEEHVLKACSLLLIHKIRRLPVVNKAGKLVGIVTTNNLYKNFLKKYAS